MVVIARCPNCGHHDMQGHVEGCYLDGHPDDPFANPTPPVEMVTIPAADWRGAVGALSELVAAGEPFIGDAFPGEQMTGEGLRLYSRWLAAMNDARRFGGQ